MIGIGRGSKRQIGRHLVLALLATTWLSATPVVAQEQAQTSASAHQPSEVESRHAELPDSPGTAQLQNAGPPVSQVQQVQPQPQTGYQAPVGTAAARTTNTAGVAVSEPAGAVMAPAKQRRVRLLFIKIGAIVGAGAAIGAVAALSAASPSRPPGSH